MLTTPAPKPTISIILKRFIGGTRSINKGGGPGGGDAGKISSITIQLHILKDLGRGKHFEGKKIFTNFLGEKSGSWAEKFKFQKKGRQKFMALAGKNLERAANLRSAPGGRHPSYATVWMIQSSSDWFRDFVRVHF